MTKLLTEKQVAEKLNVKKGTLSKWRYLGKGPVYVRIAHGGGSRGIIRYREDDLTKWQEARSQLFQSTSEY